MSASPRQHWESASPGDGAPAHEIDVIHEIAQPTSDDRFLENNNLGLGHYNAREQYQQVLEFRQHIYAEAALGSYLLEYSIHYAKWQLGVQALAEADGDDPVAAVDELEAEPVTEIKSRRAAILALGENAWDRLGRDAVDEQKWEETFDVQDRQEVTAQMQLQKLDDLASGGHEWTTVHGRMISVRHETSRSLGARLMDNILGRVREFRGDDELSDEDIEEGGIL